MNGVAGLVAWRWLFILEGIPSCLLSIVILFFLPDYPESARWLNAEEKTLAAERMRSCGSKGGDKAMTWDDTKKTLMEWRLWAHYMVKPAPMRCSILLIHHYEAILPYLSAFFQPLSFPSSNSLRSWIHFAQRPTHGHSSLCSRIRRDLTGLLVRRSLQLVSHKSSPSSVKSVFGVLPLTSFTISRSLHAAACALVATIGFIALATLPPDAYLVGSKFLYCHI